jgi:hypothetical protein
MVEGQAPPDQQDTRVNRVPVWKLLTSGREHLVLGAFYQSRGSE